MDRKVQRKKKIKNRARGMGAASQKNKVGGSMKKELIQKLRGKQHEMLMPWSDQEIKDLKDLKDAGIKASTIFNDDETMKTLFPGRTKMALERKYGRI